jgi:hypothetical protein
MKGNTMRRFNILRGTDWRGDAYWVVYDIDLHIGVGPRFYARVHALDYIEALTT